MLNLSAKIALIAALTSCSVVYAQKTEQTASVSPQEVPATLTGEWFGVRTLRLAMVVRIAIAKIRGICSGCNTSSQ